MNNLKENYKFYDLNRNTINSGHIGDYVLIWDGAVGGYFQDEDEALIKAAENGAAPGTFIIHRCLPWEKDVIDVGTAPVTPAFEVDW